MTPSLAEIKAAAEAATERAARGLRAVRDTPNRRSEDLQFIRDELAPDGLRALNELATNRAWLVERVEELAEALRWIGQRQWHECANVHGRECVGVRDVSRLARAALARLEGSP